MAPVLRYYCITTPQHFDSISLLTTSPLRTLRTLLSPTPNVNYIDDSTGFSKKIKFFFLNFQTVQLWQQSYVILHCWKNWSFGPSNTSFQNVWYAFCSSCYQTLNTRRPWPDLLSDITLVSQWCWWKATIQTNCPTVLSMSQFSSFQTRN